MIYQRIRDEYISFFASVEQATVISLVIVAGEVRGF